MLSKTLPAFLMFGQNNGVPLETAGTGWSVQDSVYHLPRIQRVLIPLTHYNQE